MVKTNIIGLNGIRKIKYSKPFTYIKNVSVPTDKGLSTHSLILNNSPLSYLGKSIVAAKKAVGGEIAIDFSHFKLPKDALPDKYQQDAAKSIHAGHDVLVTAPTGTGKTAIALYAISKNFEEGKKTFYTTPLKALSNEKYRQMQKIYGEENVGIMTGDVKINTQAPIVVMTTEIYRNMLFSNKFGNEADKLRNLKTVIFDELHYLGDVDRGGTWEQSIIMSDKNTQLVSLSATIGNNIEINDWMSAAKGIKSDLINVPSKNRHVPLEFLNAGANPKTGNKALAESIDKDGIKIYPQPNEESFLKLIDELRKKGKDGENKLPAILFVFSKKASKDLLFKFSKDGRDLASDPRDKKGIQNIINRYKQDGKYLGETLDINALKKGYAIHNSGLLPAQKELVEELFQKKLVQVVISTETLAAGINMPTRITVISSMRKPTDAKSIDAADGKRKLSINEFHQMAGRAGRRGIDTIGHVYTMAMDADHAKIFKKMYVEKEPIAIKSAFTPDYSFIAGYHKFTQEDTVMNELLNKSLQAHDADPAVASDKSKMLLNVFKEKREVLQKFDYLTPEKTLTDKGQLLSKLNGYSQIPIIDMVYGQKLGSMTPKELAACIADMSHTNENVADNLEREAEFQAKRIQNSFSHDQKQGQHAANKIKEEANKFYHENVALMSFVNDFGSYLNRYNKEMSQSHNFHKIAQDKDVATHVYDWADLNSKQTNSRYNWKEYCNKYIGKYVDEGSLFKEITQTADLLKQISQVAEIGSKNAKNLQDEYYYKSLQSTAESAIELISKEPIQEAKINKF